MKHLVAGMSLFIGTASCGMASTSRTLVDVEGLFQTAARRTTNLLTELGTGPVRFPVRRDAGSATWVNSTSVGWKAGFFPGTLWQLYDRTGNPQMRSAARRYTHGLIGLGENDPIPQTITQNLLPNDHDVGFVYLVSFGTAHAITGQSGYARVMQKAASELAAKFDPARGATRSWMGWGSWRYPVIIDNMMTIQTLHWSADNGGDTSWDALARTHALTSRQWLQRADGTTFHVVDLGVTPVAHSTHQGYSTTSTWARGQAWAIHGFAQSYQQTGEATLLDSAVRAADAYLSRLDADPVPLWDLALPANIDPAARVRDSSAGAIAAAGLIKLSVTPEVSAAQKRRYFIAAESMLQRLAAAYVAPEAPGETRLLINGVQSWPHNIGRVTSLPYADYYLLQALTDYERLFPGPGVGVGDANRDGRVNFLDSLALARNYGQSNRTWLDGDFSNDGVVNFTDLLSLARNYQVSAALPGIWLAGSVVPEPAGAALAVGSALILRRRVARSPLPSATSEQSDF